MPKIDVQKIDAQIRKLEELKRFMSDPTTAPMIEQLLAQDGSVNAVARALPKTAQLPLGQATPRGELLDVVMEACQGIPSPFVTKQVIEYLVSLGYEFQAKDKLIAVNGAMKRLVKRGKLALLQKGKGKRPSTYQIMQRFPREMKGTAA